MSAGAETLPQPGYTRTNVATLVAGALVVGAVSALMGPAVFLTAAFAAAVAGVWLFPREASMPVALAAPVANLAVLRFPNVIDIRFHQILWLILVLSLLTRAALGRALPLARPPRWLTRSLIGLACWQLVSAVANGAGVRSLVKVAQIGYFSLVLWLLAACYAGLTPERRARVLRWCGVAGGVLLLASLLYFLLHLQLPITVTANVGGSLDFAPPGLKAQAAGLTGEWLTRMGMFGLAVVSTASVLAGLPGLLLALGLTGTSSRDRRLGWVLFGLASVALLLTFSRAGWVVGLLAVFLVATRIGRGSTFWVGVAMAFGIIVLLAVPQVSARVQDFTNPEEGSTLSHIKLWSTAIGFANAQPIFGGGPYSFADRTRDPVTGDDTPVHNFVLEAAAETGWPGAAFTLTFVIALLVWGWRKLRYAPPLQFAFWCGTLASVLMALTMNGFREDTLWVWAGFMVGAAICAPQPADATFGVRAS